MEPTSGVDLPVGEERREPGRIVAVHGLPTSPQLWARVPLTIVAPALRGVATADPREDWGLPSFVEELLPLLDADTTLVGHDLGGVIAAMAALERPVRRLVLCGTALGPYWAMVRATALPPFHLYFYERHAGRRFLTGAVSPGQHEHVLRSFPPIPDLARRMRWIAERMTPPPRLAQRVAARVPVSLLWGRDDRWYPRPVVNALRRATGADLHEVPGGHLTMWEHPDAWAHALEGILRG